jgi:hypothetical protein
MYCAWDGHFLRIGLACVGSVLAMGLSGHGLVWADVRMGRIFDAIGTGLSGHGLGKSWAVLGIGRARAWHGMGTFWVEHGLCMGLACSGQELGWAWARLGWA